MSEKLEDIALRFCREIMEWPDAACDVCPRDGPYIRRVDWLGSFHYEDLNTVMEKVSEWCSDNKASFSLGFMPADSSPLSFGVDAYRGKYASAVLSISMIAEKPIAIGTHENPCAALMLACLRAKEGMR